MTSRMEDWNRRVSIKRARQISLFNEMNAYTRCSRECVEKESAKLVGVRWVDVNKGKGVEATLPLAFGRKGVQRPPRRLIVSSYPTIGGSQIDIERRCHDGRQ